MTYQERLRLVARRNLPDRIRKPLGNVAGWIDNMVIRWLLGCYFDLTGGRFKVDGCELEIPKNITTRAYRGCFVTATYEQEERELVRAYVRPHDTVLEAGACLGIVSCVTNKLLADPTRHVVVEGNPFCIPALHRNRDLNRCGFLIENCVVSSKTEVTFYLHPTFIVGGTTQRATSLPVRMPARTLAELDARHGPFSTLVVDVEGAELEAFEHARELLGRCRLVIVELHDWAIGQEGVDQCRAILTAAGLRFLRRVGITEAWQRD